MRGAATKAEAMTVLTGVTRVVRMVPLLAEFLLVFVDTLVVLSAMSCAFVFVEGVRRWVALVGGWRGPRGQVGGPRGQVGGCCCLSSPLLVRNHAPTQSPYWALWSSVAVGRVLGRVGC